MTTAPAITLPQLPPPPRAALSPLVSAAARSSAPAPDAPPAFAAALAAAERVGAQGEDDPAERAQRARVSAEELVAMTFVEPVLTQLRSTNMAAEPFAPTDAEKQFGPLLDAAFARQIVRGHGFGIVDGVARQLLGSDRDALRALRMETHDARAPDRPDEDQDEDAAGA